MRMTPQIHRVIVDNFIVRHMAIKTFGDKKINIRSIQKSDLKIVKKFQEFINSLVKEDVKIYFNKPISLNEERKWLLKTLKAIKAKSDVRILAECNSRIVGMTHVERLEHKKSHLSTFGIVIRQGYRGLGLGKYLTDEIIKLARKELKPKPKFIRLEVYATNVPAINLYKKMGFEEVARIPKQIKYKGKLVDELIMMRES